MIARMVWSQVQFASTPAFLNKCINAFSPSSTVKNPLCGITGSSGRFGREGRMLVGVKGRPPVCGPTDKSVPLVPLGWEAELEDESVPPIGASDPTGVNPGAVICAGLDMQ